MFAYPGEWVSRPRLNDIRFGEGSWMDYDEISDREAMQLQREIQALYDRMAAEKEHRFFCSCMERESAVRTTICSFARR